MPTLATVPAGYHTVDPWLISRDTAALIDFVVRVFEAAERNRVEVNGRIGHAEVQVGDSVIMMFDALETWPDTPGFLRVYVADDAAVIERAVRAGATVLTRPTELSFGDRISRFRDPFGNVWWVHQRVAEVDEAEAGRRAELPEFQTAMAYAMGVELFPPA